MVTRIPGSDRTARSSRRSLLRRPAATAGVFALGSVEGLAIRAAAAQDGHGRGEREAPDNGGYGPLRPSTRTDPVSGFEQTLMLPEGFDFTVFSTSGSRMPDGGVVPLGHDAMACFADGDPGVYRIVRNHGQPTAAGGAVPTGREAHRYDPLGSGGTTTMRVRWEQDGPVFEGAWTSLSGTIANRGGGPTPWGSWLSCEATVAGAGAGWGAEHGYVFEVPSAASSEVAPVPLENMGRFVHEAVAVDPGTGIVYETESQGTAGFYRFVPEAPGELSGGGRLQMLKVAGEWNYDTRSGQRLRRGLPVEWVDIEDADPDDAEQVPLAVFNQGWLEGGAVFGRLEGARWAGGAVYFASIDGGDAGEGQIWEYAPGGDGGTLRLVFESPDAEVLSLPDDLTVTPGGNLLLCEDADRGLPAVRGLTGQGEVFPLVCHEGESEWRGATFSPDGRVLFVNLQGENRGDPTDPGREPGRTVAVWGPWERGVL